MSADDFPLFLRFRLFLSDGEFSGNYFMLVPHLNPTIRINQLTPFTTIKAKQPLKSLSKAKIVVLADVEIVTPGDQVGVKVGNPTPIGPGGKIPDSAEAKLTALR